MSGFKILALSVCLLIFIGTILIFVDKESTTGNIITCVFSGLMCALLLFGLVSGKSLTSAMPASAVSAVSAVSSPSPYN